MKVSEIIILNDYPSGSAMVCADDKIYLAGDDASYICITDKNFKVVDTIKLVDQSEQRIPKPVKHDIEAAALIHIKKHPFILFAGSGSLAPYRNTLTMLDIHQKTKSIFDVQIFYKRIIQEGIQQLNIEGAATIPGALVFANRGNKSYRKNQLIITSPGFWNDQQNANIHIITVGVNGDTAVFNGVSGLEYSPVTDRLIMTVSTEDTYDTHGDGAIGKSYLWIINDISSKKSSSALNPDLIIDLEKIDEKFSGQKIESVCIINENRRQLTLALVADNDNGKSVLFKLIIPK